MRQIKIGRRTGIGLAIVACAIALGTPVALANHTAAAKTQAAAPNTTAVVAGYQVFNDYFCVACHTLKAGGPAAYGKLGMNFDKTHIPAPVAVATVENGIPAALPLYPTEMVGFGKVLTKTQINNVAAFIAAYSGGYTACSPCAGVTVTGFPSG